MNSPGRIVIAGGTGMLGASLTRELTGRGFEVVCLARSAPNSPLPARHVAWDARTPGPWARVLEGAAAIVNLAGRTVDCVKTPDHRDEILRSRVESTMALGQAIARLECPPPVWVQMSTAHIYGDPPELVCDEDTPTGLGLAPDVGRAWEAAFASSRPDSTRGVILRTGFVLAPGAGAYRRLAGLARMGLGGTVGSGRQGMSWIHIHDMNRLFERAITDGRMSGVYVASAPNPVSNREFMRSLRRSLGMPIGLPAPAPLVRIGAPLVLRTDPELALYGRYCVSRRLAEDGFRFDFETLDSALADLAKARV